MFHVTNRAVRAAIGVSTLAFAVAATQGIEAQQKAPSTIAPNYELASAWTSQRVSKLVFDTSVTPRWLETSDRFNAGGVERDRKWGADRGLSHG